MSLLTVLNLRPPPRLRAALAAQDTASIQGAPPAGNDAAPSKTSDDKRYDLTFGRHDLKGATLVETMRALAAEYQQMRGNCSVEMQAHGERMQRGAESLGAAAVALISETLGGAEMPPLEIWDPAFAALDRSRVAMRALSVEQALQALCDAQEAYQKARAAVASYDGDLEAGGDRAVATLKVTAAAGAVAAGVATGGAATAAGLGVVGTAGVGAASAGAYGAAQELAGQGSEVYLADTRKQIDWGAVLRRGATDAATGLVAGLVGGALTKQFSKMFGSYLGKAITDAELVELGKALGMAGPLERTFFMTAGQKFVAEFLSGAALAPVQAAITLAINRISGGAPGPKNMDEFMAGVARDVVQGGIFQALVAFLVHKMPPPARASTAEPASAPRTSELPADAKASVAATPSPMTPEPSLAGPATEAAPHATPATEAAPVTEAPATDRGGAGDPPAGGGGGGGSAGGGKPVPQLKELSVPKQEQHTYFNDPVHKKSGKSVEQNRANNRRADRLATDAQGARGDMHASLFNEKFAQPAMRGEIESLAIAKIAAGEFTALDKGGYQIKLDLNEPVGWQNQTPTNVIEVRVSTKGVWHFYPSK